MLSVSELASYAITCFCIYVVWGTYRYRGQKHHDAAPKQVPVWDISFGLDFLWARIQSYAQNRGNHFVKAQHDKYGCTFKVKALFSTSLFTISPENLKSIYVLNSNAWGVEPMRLFAQEPLLDRGIMTTDGDSWALSRRLVVPLFTKSAIISSLEPLEQRVQKLMTYLSKAEGTVDLQAAFARLTIDGASELFFGTSLQTLTTDSGEGHELLGAYNYAQKGLGLRMILPRWNILTRDRRFWDSCTLVRRYIDSHLNHHGRADFAAKTTEGSYPTIMARLASQLPNTALLRRELTNIFFPSYDGVGVALSIIFFHLARHPNVYRRLQQESEALQGREPTFEDLNSWRYLQSVINEALRVTTPVGMNARTALENTFLPKGGGGDGQQPIYVQKGETVFTSYYTIHHNEAIYGSDAGIFRPERWTERVPPAWNYLPFGGGSRICPGRLLVLTEAAYVTVRFVQAFEGIKNEDPVLEFIEQDQISISSKNGVRVTLTPVKSLRY